MAPSDKEAREDFNKFVQEMVQQNSNNGEEERGCRGEYVQLCRGEYLQDSTTTTS